jgi:hypothetical protein
MAPGLYARGASEPEGASSGSKPVLTEEEEKEFPLWARDLRRGEIVLFGSFPFAFFTATTIMDLYRSSQHDWDTRYAPWPAKSAGAVAMKSWEHTIVIGSAFGGAALIAIADHFIVRYKRGKAQREAERLKQAEPIIIRSPWPPEEAQPPEDAEPPEDVEEPSEGGSEEGADAGEPPPNSTEAEPPVAGGP